MVIALKEFNDTFIALYAIEGQIKAWYKCVFQRFNGKMLL
jgi:hypothetical protein